MSLLLVLDFSNIVHRSLHGYPPMTNAGGEPVQAAYGAGASALRLIETHRPTHVIAAMDAPRATLRRKSIVSDYKDHRGAPDESLHTQMALAGEVFAALGIHPVGIDGEEADDVAATLAVRFPGKVVIATGDKDLLGACTSDGRVVVHMLGRDEVIDEAGCVRLMGVPPRLVADYKALVGDASDGYGGVKGIGAKGASALLAEHGDLDAILTAAETVPGALGSKLRAGVTAARTSQALARLNAAAELPPIRALYQPSAEGVARLDQLEFPALARRLVSLVNAR